jgi:hypothetical protein
MKSSFVAYVDESGDAGFVFNADGGGSSRWFVLSAAVIRQMNDLQMVSCLKEVRAVLGKEPKTPLHCVDWKHEQRAPSIRRVGAWDFLVCRDSQRLGGEIGNSLPPGAKGRSEIHLRGASDKNIHFQHRDKDHDAKLTRDELPAALLDKLDADKDGFVSEAELAARVSVIQPAWDDWRRDQEAGFQRAGTRSGIS